MSQQQERDDVDMYNVGKRVQSTTVAVCGFTGPDYCPDVSLKHLKAETKATAHTLKLHVAWRMEQPRWDPLVYGSDTGTKNLHVVLTTPETPTPPTQSS